MSADFFHPTWDAGHDRSAAVAPIANEWGGYLDNSAGWRTGAADANPSGVFGTGAARAALPTAEGADEIAGTIVADPPVDGDAAIGERSALTDSSNYRAAVRAFVTWTLANPPGGERGNGGRRNSMPSTPRGGRVLLGRVPEASPAADVHLEVYSSSSAGPKPENDEDAAVAEAVAKMHARGKLYQARLNSLLKSDGARNSRLDTLAIQECILDFWDELFPTTAGIHFFNQQSPVPRMTHLHSFLTTPCPKAVGTIQCEIERVKVSRKSKGAKGVTKGMKGKFFPSYEYRLFVRDTKNDNPFHSGRAPPRKDSVLLVARNKSSVKGRNASNGHNDRNGSGVGGLDFASAASPASNASKRGVTNYYMCLPNQADVDGHYRSANRGNPSATLRPGEASGMAVSPMAAAADAAATGTKNGGAVEVGRLQSNFIGTEFQIFVPSKGVLDSRNAEERQPRESIDASLEEGPIDTAVAAIAKAPASKQKRRGSLSRMVRRASNTLTRRGSNHDLGREGGEPMEDGGEHARAQRRGSFGSKKALRRMSWGSTGTPISSGRHHRTSRRAIANNSDSYFDLDDLNTAFSSGPNASSNGVAEVENGAITYTANLLGNRPRIMDVCIPKLLEDGRVTDEWSGERREGVAANGAGSGNTMLEQFKTIQQGLENLEDVAAPNENNNDGNATDDNGGGANADGDEHGLMILQNRPPWWNIELGAFVLNFGGRVKVASVKNFQLCERNDRDHIMQFGRIEGRHAFTMDFQHPLTPMQAFAIAISSLQSKISFG